MANLAIYVSKLPTSQNVRQEDPFAELAAGQQPTLQPVAATAVSKKSGLFVPQIPYQFANPCPESMRSVNISDLSSVDINWKMLTLARPANKTDEEIFSK